MKELTRAQILKRIRQVDGELRAISVPFEQGEVNEKGYLKMLDEAKKVLDKEIANIKKKKPKRKPSKYRHIIL